VEAEEKAVHDVAVIGGGIVGTATAMALGERIRGLSIVILEKERGLAQHQTGHNSGVIHSGLYYRPGSLKAVNCVSGRDALYEFCERNQIPFERCGKLVVATDEEEIPALEELERRGRENGLEGLERLEGEDLKGREPHVQGIAGLWTPQTGIVDYVRVTEAFAAKVVSGGGKILTGAKVWKVNREKDGFTLRTTRGQIRSRFLINCTGLQSDRVARLCGVDPGLRIVPFRGEYYKIKPERRSLVKNLIYPVPDPDLPFLGVHFTRRIDGEVEAGPNAVLALKREGYGRFSFSPGDMLEILSYSGFWKMAGGYLTTGLNEYYRSFSREAFVRGLRKLIPEVNGGDLESGGSGVRAQAVSPEGKLLDDFRIAEGEKMIHVLNAPSPAATASISIGRKVAETAVVNFELG